MQIPTEKRSLESERRLGHTGDAEEKKDQKQPTKLDKVKDDAVSTTTTSRRGSMAAPPLPSSPAPRMTRLPSLQQISDRLHLPSPLGVQSASSSNIDTRSFDSDDKASASIPPKLKVAIGPNAPLPSSASPYTASPSGRLKLPASAMMRSHSSSSSSGMPTVASLNLKPGEEAVGGTSDPFGSPITTRGGESMSRGPSREGYIKGYKDVPSLSAIRERMGSTRQSISESPKVEASQSASLEARQIEGAKEKEKGKEKQGDMIIPEVIVPVSIDPSLSSSSSASSEGVPAGKKREHPLRHSWTLYFDSKNFKPDPIFVSKREGEVLGDYEKSLVTVGKFETVEGFARHLNNVRLPSTLARNSNYHMFKNGIRPMWEDPANAKGGKWVILFRSAPHLLDQAWANLTMSLVGEILDPEDKVCGVVASTRPKVDRVQVWTRDKEDVEGINLIGKRILESMALEGRDTESMSLEYQYNEGSSNPPQGLFLNIPFAQRSTSFAHAPPTPSRLGVPGDKGHTLVHHPSLPNIPRSPISPRSPLSGKMGETRDTLTPPPGLSTPRRGSAGQAFMAPMGKFAGSGTASPRRGSAQLGEA